MKTLFFSPSAHRSGQADPGVSLPSATSAVGQQTSKDVVGGIRLSDVELEQHIQDCGHRMELAMARGEKGEAREWLALQTLAIAARSPAQLARMKQVIDEGLDYFNTEGERANRMLVARGLA